MLALLHVREAWKGGIIFPTVTLYLTRQEVFRYSLTAAENTIGDILVSLTVLVLWPLCFHLLLLRQLWDTNISVLQLFSTSLMLHPFNTTQFNTQYSCGDLRPQNCFVDTS